MELNFKIQIKHLLTAVILATSIISSTLTSFVVIGLAEDPSSNPSPDQVKMYVQVIRDTLERLDCIPRKPVHVTLTTGTEDKKGLQLYFGCTMDTIIEDKKRRYRRKHQSLRS